MDEYTGKKPVSGPGISRRGSGITFRDASNHESRNVQYCNRLGCSSRLESIKGSQIGSSDMPKYSRHSLRSASGKTLVGSSSKTFSTVVSGPRKSHQEPKKLSSHKETVLDETTSELVEVKASESIPSTSEDQTGLLEPEGAESGVPTGISTDVPEEGRNCSIASNPIFQKQTHQQSGSSNLDSSLGPSVQRAVNSRNTSKFAKPVSHGHCSNQSRYGLRNLGCTSVTAILPSGSSSDLNRSRPGSVKKRNTDGESSADRGKNVRGSSTGVNTSFQKNSLSSPSLSLSERPSQQASRRSRNLHLSRDSVASVRARRTTSGENRPRLSEHGSRNRLSLPDHSIVISQSPQIEMPISGITHSPQQSQAELPSICQSTNGRSGISSENIHGRQISHPDDGNARAFRGFSLDQDGLRWFNMDGIAEVLLALERIEQDEELTYEQLLILETNLYLGGLGFHDQHRDMRLDIDNMSYEELLALEEKMGTVSTALTEEELSKCLKRSFYEPAVPGRICYER
uniref:RING-type E3 ubiquitin transferase n=1 Tax=Nelumbo nucifera TaxID=4432 RepID=A0A822ZLL6_NELNU|nr:TPA_asm: hypothetical protein HUJ06_004017 [Nelumbo nucifera]